MYYILLAIALILAYSLITRLVTSIFKGCVIVLGLGLLAVGLYVFITSASRPVNIFDYYVVEDFSVRKVE
jgi:hypothetical protein